MGDSEGDKVGGGGGGGGGGSLKPGTPSEKKKYNLRLIWYNIENERNPL